MQRALMNTTYLQSKIAELHSLHNRTVEDYGELVASLNQECSIFCDIIPSYKISPDLEGSDGVRKKKEVYNVERCEHEMLKQYEHFLQLLRRLIKKKHPEQQALGSRMCAKLVGCATDFNHADALLRLAVEYANCKSTRVAQPCLTALADYLDGQMISDGTDHVVSAILDIVRKQQYAVNPKLLTSLLHIRVAMVDMHRRDLTEEKAKNKRMKKEDKELARQMQKAKARQDRSEIAAKQTRILHKLFVVYLRVLQASKSCTKVHQSKILAPALEGLVKFAPLVNVELHQQLMKALRELLNEEETGVATKLHALVAVATLAQKDATADASEWRVDLAHFHEILFRSIPDAMAAPKNEDERKRSTGTDESNADGGEQDETASAGSTSSAGSLSSQAFSIAASMAHANLVQANAAKEWTYRVGLLIRTIDLLVLCQKHLPLIRVTAVVRRLLQWTVSTPPHISMAVLALCHRIMLRYPSVSAIVIGGSDNMIGGRGSYNPEAQETTSCHADTSFFWELSSLRNSYHPTLKSISLAFSQHYHRLSKVTPGQPSVISKQLNALGPYEVLESYNPAMGDIRPEMVPPKSMKRAAVPSKRPRSEEDGDNHNGSAVVESDGDGDESKNE